MSVCMSERFCSSCFLALMRLSLRLLQVTRQWATLAPSVRPSMLKDISKSPAVTYAVKRHSCLRYLSNSLRIQLCRTWTIRAIISVFISNILLIYSAVWLPVCLNKLTLCFRWLVKFLEHMHVSLFKLRLNLPVLNLNYEQIFLVE